MTSYVCPSCDVEFAYPQGLAVHQEIGGEWGDDEADGDAKYCCGVIYDDGESTYRSYGEPR